jgi:hypothetical protein
VSRADPRRSTDRFLLGLEYCNFMRCLGLILALVGVACGGGDGTLRLSLGSDCTVGGDGACASGYCAVLDTGTSVCSAPCNASTSCARGWSCRSDQQPALCVPLSGERRCALDTDCPRSHVCIADGLCVIPAQRSSCNRCSDGVQCAEGLACVSAGAGLPDVCLAACAEGSCRGDASCVEGSCRPADACGLESDLCAPCTTDSECGGRADRCVRNLQKGLSHCAASCAADGDCPSGFLCQAMHGSKQCVPFDGRCEERCLGDRDCPTGFRCAEGYCGAIAGFRGLCAPCSVDDECQSGACMQGADGRRSCAPFCAAEVDCPAGSVCLAVAGLESAICLPRSGHCPVGVGGEGRACTGPGGCASGLCMVQDGEPQGRCVDGCSRGACSDGRRCESVDDQPICLPPLGADGARCLNGVECAGGLCVALASESVCTQACDQDSACGEGWTCDQVGGAGLCLPATGGGGIGADCAAGPVSCTSGLCLVQPSGPVCTRPCQSSGNCPDGWRCSEVEGRGVSGGAADVCVAEGR